MFELYADNLFLNNKNVGMKKLKLNLSDFKDTEVLTREQLKVVTGGSGVMKYMCCLPSGNCSICVDCNAWCTCPDPQAILSPCSAG